MRADQTERLGAAVDAFPRIGLHELRGAGLMSRVDQKFVVHLADLIAVLEGARGAYRAVSLEGEVWQPYSTRYFDTPGFGLLRAHHRGRTPRAKVRSRVYLSSGLSFLEVKNRLNDGRTVKRRVQTSDPSRAPAADELSGLLLVDLALDAAPSDLLRDAVGGALGDRPLETKLLNGYRRLTLVHEARPERVTIDTDLTFASGAASLALVGTAIIEVKQARLDNRSEFLRAVRAQRVRPRGFSKYCVFASLLDPSLPRNRLLPTIRAVTPWVVEA